MKNATQITAQFTDQSQSGFQAELEAALKGKHLKIVLDTSGSMIGEPLSRALLAINKVYQAAPKKVSIFAATEQGIIPLTLSKLNSITDRHMVGGDPLTASKLQSTLDQHLTSDKKQRVVYLTDFTPSRQAIDSYRLMAQKSDGEFGVVFLRDGVSIFDESGRSFMHAMKDCTTLRMVDPLNKDSAEAILFCAGGATVEGFHGYVTPASLEQLAEKLRKTVQTMRRELEKAEKLLEVVGNSGMPAPKHRK